MEDVVEKLEQYKSIESTLKNSLLIAQRTSDEVISSAKNTANNTIKEAELKAKEMIEEANREVLKIKVEYESIIREMEVYKVKAESLLNTQIRLLNELSLND